VGLTLHKWVTLSGDAVRFQGLHHYRLRQHNPHIRHSAHADAAPLAPSGDGWNRHHLRHRQPKKRFRNAVAVVWPDGNEVSANLAVNFQCEPSGCLQRPTGNSRSPEALLSLGARIK
jgi:hypothetical protein